MARVTDQDLDRLDLEVLAFIAAREEALGPTSGGLENYYSYRVRRGQGLVRYERFWIQRLQNERRVFHAGIGLGPLLAGLARAGVEGVGFESDIPRYLAAEAMRAALNPDHPYEIRLDNYPAGLLAADRCGDATLLFTNVGSGWTEVQLEEVIGSMHRFARAIFDLRLFGWPRESAPERAALAAQVEDAAFALSPIDTGQGGDFYVQATSLGGPY